MIPSISTRYMSDGSYHKAAPGLSRKNYGEHERTTNINLTGRSRGGASSGPSGSQPRTPRSVRAAQYEDFENSLLMDAVNGGAKEGVTAEEKGASHGVLGALPAQ